MHTLTTPLGLEATLLKNTNREYHADKDILSSTMIKHALVSPQHFVHEYTNYKEPTSAMMLGTLMHALIMEPHTVNDLVAISPEPLDRTVASREFKAKNPGRLCMWMADYIKAQDLAARTLEQKFQGRPFYKFVEESECEQSIYFTDPDTGMKCRTRPDLRHPEFLFDIKTTRYYGLREFAVDAIRLHYDLSAYMYLLSDKLLMANQCAAQAAAADVATKKFVIVSIFNTAPHGIFFRPCNNDFILNGQKKYLSAMKTIQTCMRHDFWPSTSGVVELGLEHWQQFEAMNSSWMIGLQSQTA